MTKLPTKMSNNFPKDYFNFLSQLEPKLVLILKILVFNSHPDIEMCKIQFNFNFEADLNKKHFIAIIGKLIERYFSSRVQSIIVLSFKL